MYIGNVSNDQLVNILLKKGLNAASERSEAISDNLANVNTEGYKRKYVTFEESLKNSVYDLELKTDDEKHIRIGNNYGQIETKTDSSNSMREDGNNVDMDTEIVNQAANTLMYSALINQMSSRLSMERYVISGK
ncbi:flagellar basal body rod protein FlgB [Clostridium sp.]|uniref:flagellar basal body rod protein FlgB n=1 Tax=Clostridium sp. TaxID=1506 RepID=UPI002FDECD0E